MAKGAEIWVSVEELRGVRDAMRKAYDALDRMVGYEGQGRTVREWMDERLAEVDEPKQVSVPATKQPKTRLITLTDEQITKAASYRRALSRMPEWLPDSITEDDRLAISREAIEQNYRLRESEKPKKTAEATDEASAEEPKKHTRIRFPKAIRAVADRHGEAVAQYVQHKMLDGNFTTAALNDAMASFLGTFGDRQAAVAAFAQHNEMPATTPGQLARIAERIRHLVSHKDGSCSVWRQYIQPGQTPNTDALDEQHIEYEAEEMGHEAG